MEGRTLLSESVRKSTSFWVISILFAPKVENLHDEKFIFRISLRLMQKSYSIGPWSKGINISLWSAWKGAPQTTFGEFSTVLYGRILRSF